MASSEKRLEKEKTLLIQKKDDLNQKFLELKNPTVVKKIATQDMNMKKVGIKQVRKASLWI